MSKRLPERVFVAWEDLSNDDPYLNAAEMMDGMEQPDWREVGEYRLVRRVRIRATREEKPVRERRR